MAAKILPDMPESNSSYSRLGDMVAMARVMGGMRPQADEAVRRKRKLLADFCRMLGAPYSAPPPDPMAGLPPRHTQTLARLLAGDSEKQIAARLGVSPNTVHVYVKALYRHFDVSSRGELLARFVHLPEKLQPPAGSPD